MFLGSKLNCSPDFLFGSTVHRGCFLRKKRNAFLKLLYMDTNGAIAMLALYFFNKLIPVSDKYFLIKTLVYTIGVIFLFIIIRYFFMKIIFDEERSKS